MGDDGVIHEVVRDNLLDRVFHLELRCLPCVVEPSPEESVRTRLWMSKGRNRQRFLKLKVALFIEEIQCDWLTTIIKINN